MLARPAFAAEIDDGGELECAGRAKLLVKKDLAEEEGIAASLTNEERMFDALRGRRRMACRVPPDLRRRFAERKKRAAV